MCNRLTRLTTSRLITTLIYEVLQGKGLVASIPKIPGFDDYGFRQ